MLTIVNNCYDHHDIVCMLVARISLEMFTAASTLFFLIQFVKKTRNDTLLICLYVLVNP